MVSPQEVHLVPGKGIEGDRFYGVHPVSEEIVYEVTLVEQEALEAIRNHFSLSMNRREPVLLCALFRSEKMREATPRA